MFCRNCGKELPEGTNFCPYCGTKAEMQEVTAPQPVPPETKPIPAPEPTPEPEPVESNASAQSAEKRVDLAEIIGKSQKYYLTEFQKLESGRKPRFNWAAFLFGPAFCFYRRCGEFFKKYFLFSLSLLLLGLLASADGVTSFDPTHIMIGSALTMVGGIWQLVSMILFGLRFNRDYYQHCEEMVSTPVQKSGVSIGQAILFYVIYMAVAVTLIMLMMKADLFDFEGLMAYILLAVGAWLFIKPYIMMPKVSGENQAGIPCGLSVDQIVDVLTRFPWCKEQKISVESTPIPETQFTSQIVFEGMDAKVYLYTEGGNLHAHGCSLTTSNKRRQYWAHQETRLLLRYIYALEHANTKFAEKLREKNRATAAKRTGFDNFTSILECVLILAAIVLLVLAKKGVLKPADTSAPAPAPAETENTPSDTRTPAQDTADMPLDEPEDEPAPVTADANAPYLGDYEMLSEYEDMGANLSLYYSNGGEIYVDGIASFATHSGEVFGPVQVIDDSHFYTEDGGNRLDMSYDAGTQTLTVEETGSFGGEGVTFAGTYVKSGSVPDSGDTEPNTSENAGPTDTDVANALAEMIPSVVAIPGEWSVVTDYGTVSVTPQSTVPGAFSVSGSIAMLMAQASDGSWFAETSDNQCTITYNYAGEYFEDATEQHGFAIDSTVEFGNGYAMTNVTPLDFTYGSDPTGDTYTCYWEQYEGDEGYAYILSDADNELAIFLNEDMEPTAFSYDF